MRRKIMITIAAVFAVELVVFAGISLYDLSLFQIVRTCTVTKVITGAQLLAPIISSIFDALVTG